LLSWIPKFFKARYGLDLGTAGFLSILPYLGISICSLSAGRLADVLVKRGFPLLYVRKTMQCVAFLIPACLLTALTFVNDTAVGVSIVVAAVTITGFNSGGNAVNHLDVGPRYAAVLLGFSNTAGTIPGIIGVASAGVILDMLHSWNPIFYITAGIYVVGTMVFTSFAKTHVIFS
jgi:nitrate/nitrite transporter NarK